MTYLRAFWFFHQFRVSSINCTFYRIVPNVNEVADEQKAEYKVETLLSVFCSLSTYFGWVLLAQIVQALCYRCQLTFSF